MQSRNTLAEVQRKTKIVHGGHIMLQILLALWGVYGIKLAVDFFPTLEQATGSMIVVAAYTIFWMLIVKFAVIPWLYRSIPGYVRA